LDDAASQFPNAGDDRTSPFDIPGGAALVAREGILFVQTYAAHLVDAYGLKVFTAVNERQARRHLDAHPEIAFMLVDNRFPDMNGIERDGIGQALAEEYRIPTILVTGGPVFSQYNPLVAYLFSINWQALEAATRWACGMARQQRTSRADEKIVAEARIGVRRASVALYRELAREQPPPTGFRPYEPIDEHHVRSLKGR